MNTKLYIKIIKFVLTTLIFVSTIIVAKHLTEEVKLIYKTEQNQQALSCLLDLLQ